MCCFALKKCEATLRSSYFIWSSFKQGLTILTSRTSLFFVGLTATVKGEVMKLGCLVSVMIPFWSKFVIYFSANVELSLVDLLLTRKHCFGMHNNGSLYPYLMTSKISELLQCSSHQETWFLAETLFTMVKP